MPLPIQAEEKLTELAAVSGGFALFGICLNPETGECATFSSHGMEPGQVLGFLHQTVNRMIQAAVDGELEYIGGNDAKGPVQQNQAPHGGKLVH